MGQQKKQKVTFLLELFIFLLLAFFIGSASTTSPFYGDINVIDEGQFAAWANFMLHGQHMFKDMYIVYGPLYVYPIYVLFKLFPPSAFLIRTYIECTSLLGLIAVNLIMKDLHIKTFSRYLMNALVILLPIMLIRQALGLLCILLLIRLAKTSKPIYSFFTGFLIIVSFLVSPDIGVIAGILTLLFYLFYFLQDSQRKHIRSQLLSFIWGVSIPVILFVFWAYHEGWLTAYFSTTLRLLVDFSGMNVPNGENIPNLFNMMPTSIQPFAWIKFLCSRNILIYYVMGLQAIILTYLSLKALLRSMTKNDTYLALLLLYTMALFYISLRTLDDSHMLFTLSPLFLIFVYYLDRCFDTIANRKIKSAAKAPFIIILVIILLFPLRLLYLNHPQIQKIAYTPEAILHPAVNPPYVGDIHISKKQQTFFIDLQHYTNNHTKPKDTIFIFTDEPMLYLILNRDNATKYVLPFAAITKPMREDLVSDLAKHKPKLILIDKNAWSIDGISNERRLPEVITYIRRNYTLVQIVDGVIIYRNNR